MAHLRPDLKKVRAQALQERSRTFVHEVYDTT